MDEMKSMKKLKYGKRIYNAGDKKERKKGRKERETVIKEREKGDEKEGGTTKTKDRQHIYIYV